MDIDAKILFRLLNLYPKDILRDKWSNIEENKKNEIIETITTKEEKDEIIDFLFDNYGHTKQHIYLYECKNLENDKISDELLVLRDINPIRKNESSKELRYFFLLDLEFRAILVGETLERVSVKFKWPVLICQQGNNVCIKFTIMEKEINSYFGESQNLVNKKKSITEDVIAEEFISNISSKYKPKILDIHKGIKHLWDNGTIDSRYAKWKVSKSTRTTAMDENYTFKITYPEMYDELKHEKMMKTVFVFKKDKEKYTDHFTVDPEKGLLIFPTFSKNPEATQNVIREILKFNR